jgi:hypothetical protein
MGRAVSCAASDQGRPSRAHTTTLHVGRLASLCALELEQTAGLICAAAHLAGLAVGIVDATTVDVMNEDVALLLLVDGAGEDDDLSPSCSGNH